MPGMAFREAVKSGLFLTISTFLAKSSGVSRRAGAKKVASHFYPLIGPYDSGDPQVLEFHLLLMKLAGIDGVIVDWYGRQDFRDYTTLHQNTSRLVDQATRLGMRFAICYEDQTIPTLVEAGRVAHGERVGQAVSDVSWLAENWFTRPGYVHINRRPLLLSFGQTGLTDEEWTQTLAGLKEPMAYFSQHYLRAAASSAFDWPVPSGGLQAIERFRKESLRWPQAIPVAFPRFVDVYAEAKVQRSWGRIDDNQGATFKTTLQQALATGSPVIQIATWNDWGEGTRVEPSIEFGYRDLEVVQAMRRNRVDSQFSATQSDLRLPYRLLMVRRKAVAGQHTKQLDRIAELVAAGRIG